MRLNQAILKKYNTADTLLVISSFPKKQEIYSKGVCAVASFTKNTLLGIRKTYPTQKIVVLTTVLTKEEVYEEDGMLIVRCFRRNNPLSFFPLIKNVMRFGNVEKTMLEFEFSSFGDTITTSLLAPFTWVLAILGKQVTIVLHQVLLDLSDLSGHIGVQKGDLLGKLLNQLLLLFYKILTFPVSHVIVLEDILKTRLSQIIKKPISVIPHGVDTSLGAMKLTKNQARKKLGIAPNAFIVLQAGYVTWYKGTDWIAKEISNLKSQNSNIQLIIAGGPSFTQEQKTHYKKFYSQVEGYANAANVTLTGFVKEEDFDLYFTACDVVVFPYRAFMSSSGPLATTLSFAKPFLVSNHLKNLLQTKDIQESLTAVGLTQKDIVFALQSKSFMQLLHTVKKPAMFKKLARLSSEIRTRRAFETLAHAYHAVIFASDSHTIAPSLAPIRVK